MQFIHEHPTVLIVAMLLAVAVPILFLALAAAGHTVGGATSHSSAHPAARRTRVEHVASGERQNVRVAWCRALLPARALTGAVVMLNPHAPTVCDPEDALSKGARPLCAGILLEAEQLLVDSEARLTKLRQRGGVDLRHRATVYLDSGME
jgi:hypothetical protein